MKSALIIVAHGSRRKESNTEFIDLVLSVKGQIREQFDSIKYAFLEIESPDISSVVEEIVHSQSSLKNVVIFPYFLNAGKHVKVDIPETVRVLQTKFHDLNFQILPYFGQIPEIPLLISKTILKNFS